MKQTKKKTLNENSEPNVKPCFHQIRLFICKLRINRISVDLFSFFFFHLLICSLHFHTNVFQCVSMCMSFSFCFVLCCYVIIIADRNKISCHLMRNSQYWRRKLRISCIVFSKSCFDLGLLLSSLCMCAISSGYAINLFLSILNYIIVLDQKKLITKQ